MKRFRPFLDLPGVSGMPWLRSTVVLLFAAIFLSVSAGRARAAETASEMGPLIVAGQSDAEWQPLFRAMAAKAAVYATFEEHRWFPFRKDAVILRGEMRLSPEMGLSLHYISPEDRTMIVDAKGLVLRDGKGRSKEAPADAADASMAMLPVLRFDLPALAKLFEVHGTRTGKSWRLDLVAQPDSPIARMGRMVVIGEDEAVRRLEFRRSATQRVEIIVGQPSTGVTFTPEETKKFFR